LHPLEKDGHCPAPCMFGGPPATGLFLRHVKNIEMSNVEIAIEHPDARPAFWLHDVEGGDFFRVKTPRGSRAFAMRNVHEFRVFGSRNIKDTAVEQVANQVL